MKKILALTAVITILSANLCFAAMFQDTKGHWAESYIDELTMAGVINGKSDGAFAPDDTVTREQFLKMLLLATSKNANIRSSFEKPPIMNELLEISPFDDVSPSRWSYYYIKEAYGTILFTEEYGEKFEPVKDITREEAAVWMSRALDLSSGTPSFTDNNLIGNKEMVGAAAENGLISGFEDGSFGPGKTLTRAQAAVMLSKAGRLNAKIMSDSYTDIAKEFEKDLYLDGVNEQVKIMTNGETYAVVINGLAALGGECITESNRYYIIDIDKNDKYKEIAVVEDDYGQDALAIYRYTGSYLYLMGYIESVGDISVRTDLTPIGDEWGAISINTDGTITANIGVQYVHTMLIRVQYKINDKNRLEAESNEYYTIGQYSDFTVQNYLESAVSDADHPGIVLNPGYTGTIVKTDLKNWIYIETGSGDKGWIYISDDGLVNGESLSYYLDGLCYAG